MSEFHCDWRVATLLANVENVVTGACRPWSVWCVVVSGTIMTCAVCLVCVVASVYRHGKYPIRSLVPEGNGRRSESSDYCHLWGAVHVGRQGACCVSLSVCLTDFLCLSVCVSLPWSPVVHPSPPVDVIWAVVIVWRIRGKIIRTILCCTVYDRCTQLYAHTRMSSSWRRVLV